MTRAAYLEQLSRYLKRLPQEDFQDAMDHFIEYFDDAGPDNEAQVLAELGTPKQAASDILAQLYEKETKEEKPHTGNQFLLVILSILAAPVGLILVIILLALLVALILLILSFILTLAAFCIALISIGIGGLLAVWELFTSATSSAILLLGISFICLALGILGTKATIFIGHKLTQLTLRFIQQLLPKGERHEAI